MPPLLQRRVPKLPSVSSSKRARSPSAAINMPPKGKKQSQRPPTTRASSPPPNSPVSPTNVLPLDRPSSPTDPLPFVRPLPKGVKDSGHRYTLAQRIQCLTLLAEGCPAAHVKEKTGVSERSQRAIRKKAYDRGFNPDKDLRILEAYVVNGVHTGRPKEITKEQEDKVLSIVRSDRSGREKSTEVLAYETGMSKSSALRILHKHGLKCVKPTTEPGLTPQMKQARYEWALARSLNLSKKLVRN
jgi:hypothetical protein